MYKLETFIPKDYLQEIRDVLLKADAGHIGNYRGCLTLTKVTGVWFSEEGSNPTIGSVGEWSKEPEYKIECNVAADKLEVTLESLRKAHPYEEPLINYWKINGDRK